MRDTVSVDSSEAHGMIVIDKDSLVGLLVVSVFEGDNEFRDILDFDCDSSSVTRVVRQLDISMISAKYEITSLKKEIALTWKCLRKDKFQQFPRCSESRLHLRRI